MRKVEFTTTGKLLLCLVAPVVLAAGCKKDEESGAATGEPAPPTAEDGCEKLITKIKECVPAVADKVDELGEECRQERAGKPGFAEQVACASRDCAGFMECTREVEKKYREQERVSRLKENIEKKNWEEAAKDCRIFADEARTDVELQKLCDDASKGITEALFAELTKMRDELSPKDEFAKCMDLKEAAKKLSDDHARRAEALCAEVKVAGRVKEARDAVTKATEGGKAQVPLACEWAIKDLEKLDTEWAKKTLAQLKTECNEELPKTLMKSTVDALIKMRDSGETKDGFSKCFDLKRLAKNLGEEDQKQTEALCQEIQVAGEVAKAIEDAKKAAATKDDKVPFKCTYTIDKLEKLDSEWARTKSKEVAQICFVDAGQHVLAAKVPTMKYVCDFNVRKVYEGVKKFELKDEAIDKYIKDAAKLCER